MVKVGSVVRTYLFSELPCSDRVLYFADEATGLAVLFVDQTSFVGLGDVSLGDNVWLLQIASVHLGEGIFLRRFRLEHGGFFLLA